ncbi:uronate isomerase [Paenibacillus cisolokensis]|jgi:Glucuronate isomerase|uniref:Uronate isomerase n=1 Tax=Paenibacillus cisolokensis TaxID=1658519 RepID=A0ABQ4N1K1_9BACL|nr:glucuronate isomerase [Paenibacillus cisolokensis]GIQ62039.1 uronate isomerase [Paenibacillus cisolokensis]
MKPFMDEHFLLSNETAKKLYHDYAKDMPIIDYHCHLSPQEIYENKTYRNLTEIWLYGDHYKWRAMRANGVEEAYVTGDGDDYGKFLAWARTVPRTLGNPLYHWSHLELRRYFGIEELINERNAPVIWEKANAKLTGGGFGARDLIVKSNVRVVCTTDDPTDTLEYHLKLKEDDSFPVKVLPSFRPDKGLGIERTGFAEWVGKLGAAAGRSIRTYDDFLAALEDRVQFFHEAGGRVSDHALDEVPFAETTREEAAAVFAKAIAGDAVTPEEERKYKTFTYIHLGKLYHARGWVMQYHIKAHRNNNSAAFARLGPDTGFDSIGDGDIARPLRGLLDALASGGTLPKTILYSLDPGDNPILASLIGSFQEGGIAGKMQFGSAWWFNDTKEGMIAQLKTLADMGLLSRFVGMLTDSRSFLSYTRHEYFRRILCNLLGEWVENGEAPADFELLGDMVRDISYRNAEAYFPF